MFFIPGFPEEAIEKQLFALISSLLLPFWFFFFFLSPNLTPFYAYSVTLWPWWFFLRSNKKDKNINKGKCGWGTTALR